MNTYRNPWHKSTVVQSPALYENNAPCVAEYRGFKIYHLPSRYDFVFEGCCISQRAGITEYKKVIDGYLSGDEICCDEVAKHLRAHGHSPMTYAEYGRLWQQGKVA